MRKCYRHGRNQPLDPGSQLPILASHCVELAPRLHLVRCRRNCCGLDFIEHWLVDNGLGDNRFGDNVFDGRLT